MIPGSAPCRSSPQPAQRRPGSLQGLGRHPVAGEPGFPIQLGQFAQRGAAERQHLLPALHQLAGGLRGGRRIARRCHDVLQPQPAGDDGLLAVTAPQPGQRLLDRAGGLLAEPVAVLRCVPGLRSGLRRPDPPTQVRHQLDQQPHQQQDDDRQHQLGQRRDQPPRHVQVGAEVEGVRAAGAGMLAALPDLRRQRHPHRGAQRLVGRDRVAVRGHRHREQAGCDQRNQPAVSCPDPCRPHHRPRSCRRLPSPPVTSRH